MTILAVWTNCPSVEVADAIADALISRRLVACSNRYPEIHSRYFWNDQVTEAAEIPLLVKTRPDLACAVETVIRAHHPYQTPAILRQIIDDANRDYVDWIRAETAAG